MVNKIIKKYFLDDKEVDRKTWWQDLKNYNYHSTPYVGATDYNVKCFRLLKNTLKTIKETGEYRIWKITKEAA